MVLIDRQPKDMFSRDAVCDQSKNKQTRGGRPGRGEVEGHIMHEIETVAGLISGYQNLPVTGNKTL